MKVLLSGASGRMGKEVLDCINKTPDLTPIAGFGINDEFIRRFTCI